MRVIPVCRSTFGIVASLLVVLLVSTSVVAATPAFQSHPLHITKKTTKAPFNGTSTLPQSNAGASACANASVPTPQDLNFTTGNTSYAAAGNATYCSTNALGSKKLHEVGSVADWGAFIDEWVTVPFFYGFPNVYANFSYASALTANVSMGVCKVERLAASGTCLGEVYGEFQMWATLVDTTNGTSRSIANSFYTPLSFGTRSVTTTCTHTGGCTSSSYGKNGVSNTSGTFSYEFTPTKRMLKTRTYALYFEMQFYFYQIVSSKDAKLGPSSVSGNLDLASAGRGLLLDSIVQVV